MNRVDPRGLDDCSPDADFCTTGTGQMPVSEDPDGGGGGGGGRGGRTPLPSQLQENLYDWDALSDKCKDGLKVAMSARPSQEGRTSQELRVRALKRAVNEKKTLQAAATRYGLSWELLAAIGIRESRAITTNDQVKGYGRGFFNIDIDQNPDVTAEQARDLTWAADWAGSYLDASRSRISAGFGNLSGSDLDLAVAASWNRGVSGVLSDLKAGKSPDAYTTGHNYGQSIIDVMDCF